MALPLAAEMPARSRAPYRGWVGLLGGLLLGACALGRSAGPPPCPPVLRAEFDSAAATASLSWTPAAGRALLGYEVQRAVAGGPWTVQARLETPLDTVWSDRDLQGNQQYLYRVTALFGRPGQVRQTLHSAEVGGAIHRHLASWPLPAGFLPTRLAVDARGNLAVAGAGAGRVERFDAEGQALGSWGFAALPPACLETGTLDAVSLGFDPQGALHLAYNLPAEGQSPGLRWAKFDAQGQRLWERPLEGLFARHLAVGPGGRIYIECIDRLYQFDAEGAALAQYPVPPLLISSLRFWGEHFALLIEPANYLELGWQAPRLMVYDSPEQRQAQWWVGREPLSAQDPGRGVLKRPADFAVDAESNRVFINNAGASRIEVFLGARHLTGWGSEGEGAGQFRFAGELAVLDDLAAGRSTRRRVVGGGIARDAQGNIYVADTFNNRVQKFAP